MDTVAMNEVGNRRWHARTTSDHGWSGAWVATAIAVVATIGGAAFGAPYLALGIPAAAVSGWIVGRRIRSDGGIVGPGLAMAVLTVLVGDTLVVGGLSAAALVGGGATSSLPAAIGGAIFLWGAGLIVVGIPALVLTVPCGLVWAAIARRQARSTDRLPAAR